MIETNIVRPTEEDLARVDQLMNYMDTTPWMDRDGETKRGRAIVIPVGYTASWAILGEDNLARDLITSSGIDEVTVQHTIFASPKRHRVISEEVRVIAYHSPSSKNVTENSGIDLQEGQRLVHLGSDTFLYTPWDTAGTLDSRSRIGHKIFAFRDEELAFKWSATSEHKSRVALEYFKTMNILGRVAAKAGTDIKFFNTVEALGPMAGSYGPRLRVN